MNYRRAYASLIRKAKNRSKEGTCEGYFEKHHIKPKSLFPFYAKAKSNIVLLTPREHYVAHKLLTKVYPEKAMLYAFMVMANKASRRKNGRDYNVSSREFQRLKIEFSKNNPSKSDEVRKKLSELKKGNNHHFYGIPSEETPGYKDDKFTFVHKDGRVYTGTRTELFNTTDLTRAQISNLITGYRYSAKGWSLNGVSKPKPKTGKYAINADTSLRCWYNKKLGLGYVCDRHTFESWSRLPRRSVRGLIYNERNSAHGWVLQR